jgi:hypothetical protein
MTTHARHATTDTAITPCVPPPTRPPCLAPSAGHRPPHHQLLDFIKASNEAGGGPLYLLDELTVRACGC